MNAAITVDHLQHSLVAVHYLKQRKTVFSNQGKGDSIASYRPCLCIALETLLKLRRTLKAHCFRAPKCQHPVLFI